jgi:uncharacterized protein (DUF433 family)
MSEKKVCGDLTERCRNKECPRTFPSTERYLNCPECGTSRKCQASPSPGYKRCSQHGAPAPTAGFYGKEYYKTGKGSSKRLMKVASKYVEMTTDAAIATLKPAIEVVRTRVYQLLKRIDQNETPDRIARLYDLWKNYLKAEWKDYKEKNIAKAELDAEFEKAYHDYESWKQIFSALDLERKLSESEMKILKDMKALITSEDAYELTAQLVAACVRVLQNDQPLLKQIYYEFAKIIGDGLVDESGNGDGEIIDIRTSSMDRGEILYTGDPLSSDSSGEDPA